MTANDLADELPDVLGDPTLLRQVFMNIVSNAVDSLHERGGVISITSRTVSTDDSEPESPKLPAGQYVTVTVRDDGPGISMELLPRI